MKLEIFDPPMCCSKGNCNGQTDSKLVTFASDLEWLKTIGIEVVRYGRIFDAAAFENNNIVSKTINSDGEACLPIILFNGILVSKACYPTRKQLAMICNLRFTEEEIPPYYKEVVPDYNSNSSLKDKYQYDYSKNPCSDAPVENNCYSIPDCDCEKSFWKKNFKKIIFFLFVLAIIGIIFLIPCCSVSPLKLLLKH